MDGKKSISDKMATDGELSRRDFFGAIGAAAVAGAVATKSASGQNSFPLYQDSFGNIAPAAGDAINVGVYPPPVYSGGPGPSTVTPGYVQPNILMIMVDQLRSPRWLPVGGQAAVDQLLPNIAFLRDHSFNFPNYFVAATDCSPCRASMLTGLYSQQTSVVTTQTSGTSPCLQPGFPTFGGALAQQANYVSCWIGKWHLSDAQPQSTLAGANGPGDYGFTAGILNMPKDNTLASPNGTPNEGASGYNSAPFGSGTLTPPVVLPAMQPFPFPEVSDAAIANWFINTWMPGAPSSRPWFTAVSFVNPHDITNFPNSFGLGGTSNFGAAPSGPPSGYQPPLTTGNPFDPAHADNFLPPLNTSLYPAGGAPPVQWNVADDPATQPYGVQNGVNWGKPGMHAYFANVTNRNCGQVLNTNGWFTFLNYYFWLQSCVDYQIGRVLNSLAASTFASNTVILFTADHGDYGGSHSMHTKGGALYDESINVPMFVSFPKMRPPFAPGPTGRVRPFVCSSVDIFSLVYSLALGNEGWRNNAADPYTYLSGRESMLDAILSASPTQRRLSPIPNKHGGGFQPYILHTTDEYLTANLPNNPSVTQPSHAIAYRTVDTSITMSIGGRTFYGGAKLGMYSYWLCGTLMPDPSQPQQYEFYDYTAGNVGETGNTAFVSAGQLDTVPGQYLTAFNACAPGELYFQFPQVQSVSVTAKAVAVGFVWKQPCPAV